MFDLSDPIQSRPTEIHLAYGHFIEHPNETEEAVDRLRELLKRLIAIGKLESFEERKDFCRYELVIELKWR